MLCNALHFLRELSAHNDREWFQDNKSLYQAAQGEFEHFVSGLLSGISVFDPQVRALTARDCIFRIYRDIRFSPDKRPYKTHMGAYVAMRGGRKSVYCGYYFHLEPENSGFMGKSFCSGGLYWPEPPLLKAVRQDIMDYTEEFKAHITHPRFVELFGSLQGPVLKATPRGFPKDFPDRELLRYRHYVYMHTLSPERVCGDGLLEYVLPVMEAMKPCNDFLNRAIAWSEENGHD